MSLSFFNPILRRAFPLTRVANPLLARTFLTTAVVSKERAPKDVKKAKAPPRAFKRDLKVKRPLSGWMDFMKRYMKEHRQADQKILDIVPLAAAAWGQLSEAEKAKYGDSAEVREKIFQEAKEWRKGKEYKLAKKAFSTPKSDKPKHFNVYAHFVKDTYDKTLPLSFAEQTTSISQKWRSLSTAAKEEYRRKAFAEFEAAQSA